jgi:DNA-binding CsgD family transcriptional regulator
LAVRLVSGEALRDAARAEAIRYETARTRLKAIFAKTATSRQVELTLLIARLGH